MKDYYTGPRPAQRLDSFYAGVEKLHSERFADKSFGQFVFAFLVWMAEDRRRDFFYPEEKAMLDLFKNFAGAKGTDGEKAELHAFYEGFKAFHKQPRYCDWRFGQLIANFFGWLQHEGFEPQDVSNEKMLEYLVLFSENRHIFRDPLDLGSGKDYTQSGTETIRMARDENDVVGAATVYEEIHTVEEIERCIGWIRGVYPTVKDALAAYRRYELFVMELDGEIVGSAIINRKQVDVYAQAHWLTDAPADKVMVLHTLTISPRFAKRGLATKFVKFYEDYALENGCPFLRIDTNVINYKARALYKKLGYTEVGSVPCTFNGIEGIDLMCLEKNL